MNEIFGRSNDQENQLQAHKPKIIPPQGRPIPASPAPERETEPTTTYRASVQVTPVFGTYRTILQPLKPEIEPSEQILERALDHDLDMEAAD